MTQIRVDEDRNRFIVGTRYIVVSTKELSLLRVLAARRDQVIPYRELIKEAWGEGTIYTLHAYIHRIRPKVAKLGIKITSFWGKGLELESEETDLVEAGDVH